MELPLFPLSAVLLPGGRMPLRIFEQRYLDLVRDTLRSEGEFGVVWIRRGSEVAQRGRAAPDLGDYGSCARIVDWNQQPDGLLGITIEGTRRFDLLRVATRANGLQVGDVELRPALTAARMPERWHPLVDVLRNLEQHPHVRRLGISADYNDAWQVAHALLQLLPLEEFFKYEQLGADDVEAVLAALDMQLRRLSGAN